jgi:hypothetical protein
MLKRFATRGINPLANLKMEKIVPTKSSRTTTRQSSIASDVGEAVDQALTKIAKSRSEGWNLFPFGITKLNVEIKLPGDTGFSLLLQGPDQVNAPKSLFRMKLIADDILDICVALDQNNDPVMGDCNAFVKKVGTAVGVAIPDLDADGIVNAFNVAPFSKTTMNPVEAMAWAKDGLVIAGMTKADLNPAYGTKYKNGHVAVVHSIEDPAHPGFPMASWGVLNGRGKSNTSIRLSFPAQACTDNTVRYAFAATST